MKREVVLHVGSAKTGTSSIQAALAQNQEFLVEHGILYPNITGSGFGQLLERGLLAGNADPDCEFFPWEGKSAMGRISYLIDSSTITDLDIGKFVLSGERLSIYAQSEAFWELLKFKSVSLNLQFNVVIYLRDPYNYFVSCYKQQVKQGHFWGTVEQFVERFLSNGNFATTFTFYKSIPKIIEMAKRFDIELSIFRYEEHSKNLENHFFATVLNLDTDLLNLDLHKFNPSMNMWEVEFHRGVASISPMMAFSLGLERTDLHLSKFRKEIEGSNEVMMPNQAVNRLEKEFLRYKESIDHLIPFSRDVNVRVHEKVVDSLNHHESLMRDQMYEIGRFVAISHEHGYVDMENRRKR